MILRDDDSATQANGLQDARIEAVDLVVKDLDAALGVYRDVLGFRVLKQEGRVAHVGAETPFLRLHERPDARERPARASGLYHVAYLLPSRADLGAFLRRLIETQWPVQGASDHDVSEAVYLSDVDGNGIEVYADRPRSEWRRTSDGGIHMTTAPMDVQGVLAAATGPFERAPDGTRVGHVHLHVGDWRSAERFYRDAVGFDLMTRYPGASFLAAGGYHHHVAVNEWLGHGAPPAPEDAVGLTEFTIALPTQDDVDAVAKRADAERDGDAVLLSDPANNRIRIVAE